MYIVISEYVQYCYIIDIIFKTYVNNYFNIVMGKYLYFELANKMKDLAKTKTWQSICIILSYP